MTNKKTDEMTANSTNPAPVTPEELVAQVQEMPADTAENVVQFQGRKGGTNAFAAFTAKRTEAVQNKVQLVTQAKEQLKAAADLQGNSETAEQAALEPAQKGGLLLYTGLTSGVISNEEVSEILGGTFGWKTKQNGEQSATPRGLGEVIRKRVGRAFKAYDYAVNGNEPVAFFEPLDREDVAPFVTELNDGKRSIWSVYDGLAELKAEKTGKRPKACFDPKKVAGLARDLGANIGVTVETIQRTPGLFAAYAGLMQMLDVIGQEMPVPDVQADVA